MAFRSPLRTTLVLSIALLAVQLASAAAAQQPSKASKAADVSIRGIVKSLRTGQPIEGARVYVLDAPQNERSFTKVPTSMVWTNSKGEFVFENLDAGSYRVVVAYDGSVKRESPKLVLAAGERIKDMVFRMTPTGTISGSVHDASGKPLAGAIVTLVRPFYNASGVRTLGDAGTTQTNDLGEYRLFWITPGKYYVMAGGGIDRLAQDVQGAFDTQLQHGWNGVSESYTAVFFPGVADLPRASLVDLEEGTELRGMDFTLSRQRLYSVSGRVIDSTTGKPPIDGGLTLTQRELTGHGVMEPVDFDATTGTFEISLPPGRYVVAASGPDAGAYPSYSPPGVPWADRELVVGDGSVDIELAMAVQPVIAGQITLQAKLPAGKSLDHVTVSLSPVDALPPLRFRNPSAESDNTGKFRLAAVQDGFFRVTASGLPDGFYLKDARLNDTDVLNGSSRFSASGVLSIVIGESSARIDGRVIDEQMHAVAGIEAVLIPDDHRNRGELFKRAVTDQEGRFSIPNIAPGDYRLFAWENIEANSWFDENVVKRFEEKGTRVHAAETSHLTVELKQIPEEAAP